MNQLPTSKAGRRRFNGEVSIIIIIRLFTYSYHSSEEPFHLLIERSHKCLFLLKRKRKEKEREPGGLLPNEERAWKYEGVGLGPFWVVFSPLFYP